ncbi:MAG: hypothetical protein U0931_39440 [Vulcanimicrobiota bacterium]
MLRLDVTSPLEWLIVACEWVFLCAAGYCIFVLLVHPIPAPSIQEAWVGLAVSVACFCAFYCFESLQDDTYILHFPTRMLLYQAKGPFWFRLNPVKSFNEIRAVGVDYEYMRRHRYEDNHHRYCLGLVTQDGKVLRVSDWQIEAYPQVSQAAQTVSQATGWALLDAGPHQAIQVQSSGDGTRWATQVDRGWISSLSALLSLILFVVAVIYQLSHL